MPHIAILVHRHGRFDEATYLLKEMAELWREQDFRVTTLFGPEQDVTADILFLHVDLTVVPAEYLEFASRFPVVINERVVDISKRAISRNLVRRGDGYDGPVMVKTNRNAGGKGEAFVAARKSTLLRYSWALRNRLPWTFRSRFRKGEYRVFDSVRDVPLAVWYNPDLVVERFLPERREGCYCMRSWIFLGDREENSLLFGSAPVVMAATLARPREVVSEIPDDLRRFRRELGFEFGKFDYAILDGQTVVYDVNRTPTLGRLAGGAFRARLEVLAAGIHSFL